MDREMLALWSVRLLAVAGIALVFTGLSFFLLPEYAAENFPWNVSPLVAMTTGGWTLGMGMAALEAIRGRSIARFYPVMLAVWSFCVFELIVLVAFAGVVRTDHWLTWPYVAALVLGLLSGALGAPIVWSMRARLREEGEGMPRWIRVAYAAFVVVVLVLAAGTLLRDATGASVFPEPLSGFTTRAFSAFFLSLVVGALPLLFSDDVEPAVEYARVGLYLVVLITVAALSFLHIFDFSARPGGLLYIGAYLLTAVVALLIVARHRRPATEPRWRH